MRNTLQDKVVKVAFLYLLLVPGHSNLFSNPVFITIPREIVQSNKQVDFEEGLKKVTGEKEDKEEVQNLFEDAAQRRRHIQEVYIGYLSYQRK